MVASREGKDHAKLKLKKNSCCAQRPTSVRWSVCASNLNVTFYINIHYKDVSLLFLFTVVSNS